MSTELLYAAVKYTLDRIQVDPNVRYYCGWGTEVFYQLIMAEAAHLGKPLEDVEKARRVDTQPHYRKTEPDAIRLRDQIDELRQQLDSVR